VAQRATGSPSFQLVVLFLLYLQAGSPSFAVVTVGFVVFMPMPQTTPESCE
jgi:hypothetical protein